MLPSVLLYILVLTGSSEQQERSKRATTEDNVKKVFTRYKGQISAEGTYYGKYPTGHGACSMDPMPPVYTQQGWIKVAAGYDDFQKSLGCGMCLKITGTGKGSGTNPMIGPYYAVVIDLCGGCKGGGLDFYIPGDGRWDITSEAIDCPNVDGSDGKIMLRFTGSNPWYLKLQVSNSKLPTAALSTYQNGKWYCMERVNDNHFVLNGIGEVKIPMQLRLTSIAGETLSATVKVLGNDKYQNSGVQYKSFKQAANGSAPNLQCYGQGGLVMPGSPDEITKQGGTDVNETKPTASAGVKVGETKPPPSKTGAETGPTGTNGTEVTGKPENFCQTKASGIYADPWDCKGFIKCAEKRTYREKCPDKTLFNPKIMNCDHAANVSCNKDKGQRSTVT